MKITPEHIDSLIAHAQYHRFKGTTVTTCCITLKNGHTVVGSSACVDPAEFRCELGQKIAYGKARSKIFDLEAYLLQEDMHQDIRTEDAQRAFNERSAFVSDSPAPHASLTREEARDDLFHRTDGLLKDIAGYLKIAEKGRGLESTEEAEQDELEWPPLNYKVEIIEDEEAEDNKIFPVNDLERTLIEGSLKAGHAVHKKQGNVEYNVIDLCDEGAICEVFHGED